MAAAPPQVLVVEPGSPVQRLIAWGLREEGFSVEVAPGDDAPPDFALNRPDVVVLNTMLPAPQRRDIVVAMRDLVPQAAVIELVPEDRSENQTGADVYLPSPHALHELVAEIGAAVSPATAGPSVDAPAGPHAQSMEVWARIRTDSPLA